MTDRHGMGGNQPPANEAFSLALEDAYATAKDFLDGSELETKGQADAVGRIISEVKKIKKDAETARKAEKEPHLEAGRAVDAKWKPLADRADTIIKAAQAPLTAYLNKLAAQQAEEQRKAREEADRKAQEAIEAQRASAGNVEAIEKAETLQREADLAAKEAAKASKAKAHVAGVDRAVGLRTYKVATVTDRRAALNWIAKHDPEALTAFVEDYARRHASTRPIDGVIVNEERRVA